jgi:phage tail protein X
METRGALMNHSDEQVGDQQTVASSKVIVRPGDNLTEIALQHYPNKERSGIEAILKSNPQIVNRDLIYPGQVFVLPEIETIANPRQESGKKTETTFAVQICTLFNSSKGFAEAYVNELKQKGYSAYSVETKTNKDKIIYKIFIGNYGTKEEAETAAMNFQKNEGKPDIIIKPEIAQSLESKKEEK